MLFLLEDDPDDTRMLKEALALQGISQDLIVSSPSLEQATAAMNRLGREGAYPVVIIADLGLKDQYKNGADFIRHQFGEIRNQTGGGVWTALISLTDLTDIRSLGFDDPLPHLTYEKRAPGWHLKCAEDIAQLFIPSFPFDEGNDLSPPAKLNIPPADRIYFYTSGMASRLSLDFETDAGEFSIFTELKENYSEQINPILMYRGHYAVVAHYKDEDTPKKLQRALLRWRTVALECEQEEGGANSLKQVYADGFSIKHICSWSGEAGEREPVLDEGRGFPIRSVQNDISAFRTNKNVVKLENFLFQKRNKGVLQYFPTIKRGTLPQVRTGGGRVSEKAIGLSDKVLSDTRLPLLNVARRHARADNFLTRLHFVLTEEEVENYNDWKREWRSLFAGAGSPGDER